MIKWDESGFDKTIEQAKMKNRDILVYVYAKWCGQCNYMNKHVLPMPEIRDYINSTFASYRADETDPESKKIMAKYDIASFPTFLFLNSGASEIGRFVGRAETTNFLEIMKKIESDKTAVDENLEKLKASPGSPEILYRLLVLSAGRRFMEDAEKYKGRIEAVDPQFYAAHRESILLTLEDTYFFLKDYPEAVSSAEELIKIPAFKDKITKYYFIAGCYINMGNYGKALDIYWKILGLTPDNISSYITIIQQSYIYNIELNKAVTAALKGLSLKAPDDQKAELYFELSRAYKKKNNKKKALEMIDNAISLHPAPLYDNIKKQITGAEVKENTDLLSFSDKAWNFGTVKKGKTAEYTITLENHCGYPADITVIKTCDCLDAKPDKVVIENEKKALIKLSYDSSDDNGKVEKYFVIKSDIKGLERTLFPVTGTVESK